MNCPICKGANLEEWERTEDDVLVSVLCVDCGFMWNPREPKPQGKCAERLEALRELQKSLEEILTVIYPGDVFVGCDECESRECDCDLGVQIVRTAGNRLERLREIERK